MLQKPRCVGDDICDELGGSQDTTFALLYEGDPPSRLILSTTYFRVIADASPLATGHLLVVPSDHYLSFAQVMAVMSDEVPDLLSRLLPLYEGEFGAPLIIEHGSSNEMNTTSCISHAHLHVLPVDGALFRSLLRRDGLVEKSLRDLRDLRNLKNESYFLSSHAGKHFVYRALRPMRSQYLRSVAGEVLQIPDPLWDYSIVVRRDMLRETVRRTAHWRGSPFDV